MLSFDTPTHRFQLRAAAVLRELREELGLEAAVSRLRFQWFALEELERLDVRPAFLTRALGSTSPVPMHFVVRD